YIGGGTPSILSEAQIKTLAQIIEQNFGPVKNFKESTFEANPESLTEPKLKLLKTLGFNRLSIGMQSLADKELKAIKRAHTKAQFLAAYKTAQKYFDNINIDIIAGLPGQTLAGFKKTLQGALALAPRHVSVYGLQAEEGTPLYDGGFEPDDKLGRQMLELAASYLKKAGYEHYEISNFAKRGAQSLHNINYWQNGQYLGLGAAAASYIKGARAANTEDLQKYIKGGKKDICERLRGKAKVGETILLGLRMLGGLELTPVMQKYFGKDFAELKKQKLIKQNKNNMRLSKEGLFMANIVFRHFVEPF
ncbi:MAG: radical SAM family heme chaperone HemW, partial [Elusimicrobiota bacterium]|nr:radical SAM family heme chaperone HemW [Elusimicrobiota bacterium]